MVLDVSDSMSSTDVAPTRLQAAKEAALVFLDDLPSDLTVSLVAFSGQAQVLAPPTSDRSVIVEALVALPRGDGSAIGDAVDTALGTIETRWEAEGEGRAPSSCSTDGMDVAQRRPAHRRGLASVRSRRPAVHGGARPRRERGGGRGQDRTALGRRHGDRRRVLHGPRG